MKEALKLGGILLLITSLCAGLLGLVNSITTPLIQQGKERQTKEAIQKLLPDAEEVVRVSSMENEMFLELYIAKTNGEYVGTVAKVAPNGYAGAIEMLVGIRLDDTISGIQILTHAETPGLGANMTKDSFKDQYIGKKQSIGVVKTSPTEDDIVAITGATVTSQAVTKGVNEVLIYVIENKEQLIKEGN